MIFLGTGLDVSWPIQAAFVVKEPLRNLGIPYYALSLHNNFTQSPLMKIEWLIASVLAVVSPARAEREILEMILGVFWSVQPVIVVGDPLFDLGIPS